MLTGVEKQPVDRSHQKKRLLLFQPKPTGKVVLTNATNSLYSLGLFVIDALTPKTEWDVEIIDEGRKPFNLEWVSTEPPPDLVGVSIWTDQAPRGYEISQAYRKRGVPVILGGPHPSALPEEALEYADSVCIGEAEDIWTKVLADVQKESLQQIYQGDEMPTLDKIPILRSPLRDKYKYGSIQTARGCPYKCSFCSVTSTNGAIIRYRPTEDVIEEFRGIKQRFVMVVDDNIIGSGPRGRERVIELCKELVKLRKQGVRKYWGTQATQNLGQDDEVLEWMYKAGCRLVLFGLESVNKEVIDDVHKGINKLGDYKRNIQNTQRHGIGVIASFIFGTDKDSPSVFKDTVDFIKDSRAATQNLNIACPLPGTEFYEEVKDSGRLPYRNYPEDWKRHNLKQVVLVPRNHTPRQIYEQRIWAERQLAGNFTLLKRAARLLWDTRSLSTTAITLGWNVSTSLSREQDYREQIRMLEEEMKLRAQEQPVNAS